MKHPLQFNESKPIRKSGFSPTMYKLIASIGIPLILLIGILLGYIQGLIKFIKRRKPYEKPVDYFNRCINPDRKR